MTCEEAESVAEGTGGEGVGTGPPQVVRFATTSASMARSARKRETGQSQSSNNGEEDETNRRMRCSGAA